MDISEAVVAATPARTDPNEVSQEGSMICRQFTHSKCFKITKTVLIVIYALNIVAWGGMLFLILVGAANKTMPEEQTRKNWIEIDSQILNALFCVTGLGLIPWRVRDAVYAHVNKYEKKIRDLHVYTTRLALIRTVVWIYIANSFFQIGMAVCMWSMDMNTRPPWLVGLFVGLGCLSGLIGGLIQFTLLRQKKKKEKLEQDRTAIVES